MVQRGGRRETANRDTGEELQGMGTSRESENREHSRTGEENRGDVTGTININKQGTVQECLTVSPYI